MRKAPLRPAILWALMVLTGRPDAVSGASPITSLGEAWASQSGEAQRPSNEWMAWKLGREYAFALAWDMLNKSAESEKSLGFAQRWARALEISDPPPPAADYSKRVVALAKEVDAKYGEKTRYHFLVGIRVTDAGIGAAIGADVTTQVADLASFLERSGITASVWRTRLKAIQTKATATDLRSLAQAIDEHLKR